jgi:hypothetical protein
VEEVVPVTARDDLAVYLAPLIGSAVGLDGHARCLAAARRVVDALSYVVDDTEEIETTTYNTPGRSFIRHRWITVRIPNGVEHVTLPFADTGLVGEARPTLTGPDTE